MRTHELAALGARLGKDTHGVVSADELRAAKADMTVLPRLLSGGDWTRLWRGMYLTAAHPPGQVVLSQAAIKHAALRHRDARGAARPVVTGLAGARALGLRWVPDGQRVQVLVGPDVQRGSNEHVLVRRAADLETVPTWNWGGLPVANAARLVVDGARECRSLRDVRGLVLGAIADGQTAPDDVLALLHIGAVGGTAWARRAVRDAQRGAASPPEAELADDLLGGGWPFYVNAEVWIDGAFVCVLDVYLVGTGVGGELDSRERHEEPDALDDTLQRHDRAGRRGLALVHVTPNRYRADPAAFHARLFQAVADRRRSGLGEPHGLVLRPRGLLLS